MCESRMRVIRDVLRIATAREHAHSGSTLLLLIRHAHVDAIGHWLAGRMPGVTLSACGTAQAADLAEALAPVRLDAVYCSPLERAIATAQPIVQRRQLAISVRDDLVDIDFGRWTGRQFDELAGDAAWAAFNDTRATARVPGGEDPAAFQNRAVHALQHIAKCHPHDIVAVVSHADVLRSALLHYAGWSLNDWARIDLAPASISAVRLHNGTAEVLALNEAL
jgi:broad specificity phosphatase PhoE